MEKELNILKEKNKELNSYIKILYKTKEKQKLGKNPLNFYDIIVNINSEVQHFEIFILGML